MKIAVRIIVLGLFALTPSLAHAANIVLNGDFEDPNVGSGFGTTATSWVLDPSAILATNAIYIANAGATGDTGTGQFIAFGGGDSNDLGSISQPNLALVAGEQYTLSFLYGAYGVSAPQAIGVVIGDLNIDLLDPTAVTNLGAVFSPYSFVFTANANGINTLIFLDKSLVTASSDGLLDRVTIEPLSTAAVPEPATLALLGLGLAAAGARRRGLKSGRT